MDEHCYGTITRLNWAEQTGIITEESGDAYTFSYEDIADANLAKSIRECLRTDLGGKIFLVKFFARKNAAWDIRPDDTLVDRARRIAPDPTKENRFEIAYNLCKKAVDTPDIRRALVDMLNNAIVLFNEKEQSSYLEEALTICEKNAALFPGKPFPTMALAQGYGLLRMYSKMLEYGEKALSFEDIPVKTNIALTAQYLTMIREYYTASGDKALLTKILEVLNKEEKECTSSLKCDPQILDLFRNHLLHHRVFAECELDMLEDAEEDFEAIPQNNKYKPVLSALIAATRTRLAPVEEEPAVQEEPVQEEPLQEEQPLDEPAGEELSESDNEPEEEAYEDIADNEEEEEEIPPYTDFDGWAALKLTKKDVIDYALHMTGPERIPAMLAYLRAGAELNREIAPVYHAVALAANDPMEAPDYSIAALIGALATGDPDYPVLNDCCMGAAFLRASFLSGRGYDYSVQGLRDSISISQQIPALRGAYDTRGQFRSETGSAIDIYADYCNQGTMKLSADVEKTVYHAEELYAKYVLTPPREKSSFARILETRKILFSRDGYLAVMLRHIMERDQQALEAEKADFVATYLGGVSQFSASRIATDAIDALMTDAWDQAGKKMQIRKAFATLQGTRRSNLRSNITEIITVICQWYALSEQIAGLIWRTEQGESAYQRLRPRLLEQLQEICQTCTAEAENNPDPEMCTGLFLLSATAKELSARLDGSWSFEQEKYLYVDFLRSNYVMLKEDFMPELSSTFCILPEFNILARIRQHMENPKRSFQEQLDLIYGKDKACNNYGTADRILEYLEAVGERDTVSVSENPERFVERTEMQIDMRFRSFRETYALAINYGQIIKSDHFCYTLEDTVKYWHAYCKSLRNYGFFTSILSQAENQIQASARQYETQLDEQLDALISSNQQYFSEHPDHAEAIRAQVANQNFTVAEDWMARIRIGDFSLELQQPKALEYLNCFWNEYVETYKRVADASRTLNVLLGRRVVRNKDAKGAQLLIDNWLPSSPERITNLLTLLGWQNICVTPYQFAGEPRTEIYEVKKERSAVGLVTPQHSIAAFGTNFEKKGMYVVCLYGIYDCDRLCEKMRALDVIEGSKIFLLDYALGQADRRALARKLKRRESTLRSVNIVIDRVLITHLADHYNENLINSILMADAMPFAYCQPYVVDAIHAMPPEMFIGRKEELLSIERPDGANLLYGGRQLGKTALLRKAEEEIEGYADGQQKRRAVLVDIKNKNCADAARKLSEELIYKKITPDAEVTEDWEELCQTIKRQLRREDSEISYFLLMLDEADEFIKSCADTRYRPLEALKDIQQTLPGRFKFVLAGLHNIIRFYHQVALGNNSVITHMSPLKITPFRTPEAQELLTVPLSYLGFSLPSNVTVSQILATCNYFPGLIQLYAQKLIESIRTADYAGYDIKKTPPYLVTDEHLRRVMADASFVEEIHQKFNITATLDEEQENYYSPLTLLIGMMYGVEPSKSGYTAKEILHQARDLSIRPLAELDETKMDTLLQELQDLNILRSVSNNSYLLASKNFRDLLGSDDEIADKLAAFGGAV